MDISSAYFYWLLQTAKSAFLPINLQIVQVTIGDSAFLPINLQKVQVIGRRWSDSLENRQNDCSKYMLNGLLNVSYTKHLYEIHVVLRIAADRDAWCHSVLRIAADRGAWCHSVLRIAAARDAW